jgi:hypothetical protein
MIKKRAKLDKNDKNCRELCNTMEEKQQKKACVRNAID